MSVSPELLKLMRERMRGTMMELIDFRPVEVSKERVVAELPFRADLCQPTGVFHAGAILTLADTAATILANRNTQPATGEFNTSRFALTIQLNANFVHNTSGGKIVAEAVPIHIGRRTIVVRVTIRDDEGCLLSTVTTTMLIPYAV